MVCLQSLRPDLVSSTNYPFSACLNDDVDQTSICRCRFFSLLIFYDYDGMRPYLVFSTIAYLLLGKVWRWGKCDSRAMTIIMKLPQTWLLHFLAF